MAKRKSAEHPLREIFRTNLRNRRQELGLTQTRLAQTLGKTPAWIALLESPARREVPSLELLAELARHLQCAPHDLLVPGKF